LRASTIEKEPINSSAAEDAEDAKEKQERIDS
jgi:hypothetical protein